MIYNIQHLEIKKVPTLYMKKCTRSSLPLLHAQSTIIKLYSKTDLTTVISKSFNVLCNNKTTVIKRILFFLFTKIS